MFSDDTEPTESKSHVVALFDQRERIMRDLVHLDKQLLHAFKTSKRETILDRPANEAELRRACLYYDHSFGLMDGQARARLVQEATWWHHAFRKVEEDNVGVERKEAGE